MDVARAGSKRRGGGRGEQAGEKEDVAGEHLDLIWRGRCVETAEIVVVFLCLGRDKV